MTATTTTRYLSATPPPLLSVDDLAVSFRGRNRIVHAVTNATFSVDAGQRVGLIGESGSGKSVTAKAIMGLLDRRTTDIRNGSRIIFQGTDLVDRSENELRSIRGNELSIIFQNPMHSLNPVFTIGDQLSRVIRAHRPIGRFEALAIAAQTLASVDLPAPEQLLNRYPHQLSGGMRQRVLVGMALSNSPALVIADEPTSALDVTAQDTVLSLLSKLSDEGDAAVLMITHDMGVVARFCESVNVMYGGRIVEQGTALDIFRSPKHPYTAALLATVPNPTQRPQGLHSIPGVQETREGSVDEGCPFATRCEYAVEICSTTPVLTQIGDAGHTVACHIADELNLTRDDWDCD